MSSTVAFASRIARLERMRAASVDPAEVAAIDAKIAALRAASK